MRIAVVVALSILWLAAEPGSGQAPATETGNLTRPARLHVEGVTLDEALRQLQGTSGVALAFSPDVVPLSRRVTCRCREATLREALERLLDGTGLRFVDDRRRILIGPAQAGPQAGDPEWIDIAGWVVDAQDGRPVVAADIVTVPGSRRTTTASDGRFLLPRLPAGQYSLRLHALGYDSLVVAAGGTDGAMRVELERAAIPLDEVVISPGAFGVLDVIPSASGVAVSREDIEAIPQIGDDVFRTLTRMPGVSTDDISTRLNVRGGTDRDLLVRLDGVELFEPYHLKDLDGALGIVDVQSLGSVALVTGGFPAEFGHGPAGVFDMRTRTPPAAGTRTTLSLSLSSMSYNGQGSFGDGRGQWLATLRRGFLEYVLAITDVQDDISPTFWDVLGKVGYLVSDRHSVSAHILWSGDNMRWKDEESGSLDSEWTNGYGWLTWKGDLSERLRVETILSTGKLDRNRLGSAASQGQGGFTPISADVQDVAEASFAGARQDWELDLSNDLLAKGGVDLRTSSVDYDYHSRAAYQEVDSAGRLGVREDSARALVSPEGSDYGAYLSLRGRPSEQLTWEVGGRYDWHRPSGDGYASPRVLLRWDAAPATTLRASWGLYHHPEKLHELQVQDGQTTFGPPERADQLALGLEHRAPGGIAFRAEAYRRVTEDPRPEFVNLSRQVNPLLELEADRRRLDASKARAEGVELFVARDGPLSWSASYALARSEILLDGAWVRRTLDQRHTLNLFASYRAGERWQLSGTWQYHTGWPFTNQIMDVTVKEPGTASRPPVLVIRREFGPLNGERLPSYHRLDIRITHAFFVSRSRLELFVDVFNLYNRTNLRGYGWGLRGSPTGVTAYRDTGEEQLPIMPTLGVRWTF